MKRRILLGIAAILVLALIAPYIPADRYREPTRNALESALGRKVEIASVRFRLLPQPGFTADNVTIGEDPSIGLEPVAYVGTLRAIPRITALLTGRLEFASVDLEDASLNLTRIDRPDTGVLWNFSALMRPQALSRFPTVHIRSGRINFKFGDTKSLFYLLDTDLDLWPPDSARGPWTLRVKGEPARTDRPAHGFGSFMVEGEWHPADSATTLDVKLEKSELGDMLELFNGYQSGIEGSISGSAHLAGPVAHIGISGTLTVADLHGWSQSPPGGNEWPMKVGGVFDVPGQTIDLTARLDVKESPLELHYRAFDYLRRPQWGVTATLDRFPLAPLVGIARNLGWAIPADFHLEGVAEGAVSYSMPQGAPRMDGSLMLANSVLNVSGAPPLRIAHADLNFAGSTVTLQPSSIANANNETATLQGVWDTAANSLTVSLSSDGMAIASLSRQVSLAGVPLLSQATAGMWKGSLRYSNQPPDHAAAGGIAGWTGNIHLEDTVIPFEAFADPVHIVSADAAIDGADLTVKHLTLSTGGLEAQGDYRYDPAAARPHRFHLTLTEAGADAIERLMMPALHRGNFFTYAFNFGRAPEPDWLRNMRADGTIQIGAFDLAGNAFTKVRTHVLWDATELRLPELQSQLGLATFSGSAAVHLARRQPGYEVEGKLNGFAWRSGTVDAEGSLMTSGTGNDLLANLRAKGSFEAADIDLTPLDTYDSATGAFEFAWDARNPRLHLTQLEMTANGTAFEGTADMQENGQLVLRLSDGARHIQASGALLRGEALKVIP